MEKTFAVGIDIGSTATKAVVLADAGAGRAAPDPTIRVAHALAIPTGFSGVDAAERVLADVGAAGFPPDACRFVATGYGRVSVPFADKAVTEITCHARGAHFLFGGDGVVIDIGGQDTKAIVLEGGKVAKFAMNDKCSAGTGKFLEIMANRMGVTQDELSALARGGSPTVISSMCTVFAESEVISLIGQGAAREDIAWGVIESVVAKVAPLVPRVAGARYFLTGGLCENDYVVERLSAQVGVPVETMPLARFAGAIGAALSV